jgi:hypothetical protein
MNFDFVWKSVNVKHNEITGVYMQTIYGENLVDAVSNFTAMHGDLWEDENGNVLEITSIKEVRE